MLYLIDYGIFVTALIWGMSSGGLSGLEYPPKVWHITANSVAVRVTTICY